MSIRQGMWRAVCGGVFVAALIVSAAPVHAEDFILYSQNILRFGHGSRTATQCTAIGNYLPNIDIMLIQELMVSTTPCTASVLPGTYAWKALGPYGKGSYYEYYGFLYSSTARKNGPTIALGGQTANAIPGLYMRPPQGVLFKVTPNGSTTAKYVWIANFHLVWGSGGVGPRRAEATASAGFFSYMATLQDPSTSKPYSANVIIAGDWNLPTTDTGFTAYATSNPVGSVQQTAQTSLNRTGGLSQSYDHFVTSPTVTLSSVSTVGFTGNTPLWRQTVSDHLGIQAGVTLP